MGALAPTARSSAGQGERTSRAEPAERSAAGGGGRGEACSLEEVHDLEQLLDHLQQVGGEQDEVQVGDLVDAVGRRSFGPLLLVAGLVPLSPLSGIPGVPTVAGVAIATITVQLLLGRESFWLPAWVERKKIGRQRLEKTIAVLRRPARFVDRFLRPRLEGLTRSVGVYTVALLCMLIAILMPPLELVPFSTSLAGAAVTTFGLALIASDGLLGLIALVLTLSVGSVVAWALL